MNRKQKIIVSVVGIFIVLLALLGLTYAYFITQIRGNKNDKSISVTTANLELTYADGNDIIEATKVYPGTEIATKTFTVENTGNAKVNDYVVMIENVAIMKDGSFTTFESPKDLVYTLTCTIYESDDETKIGTSCNGKDSSTLPMGDSALVINDIDVNEKHLYRLTVEYLETYSDQTSDKNKSISFKININNERELNPYEDETLAYNIVNNIYTNAINNPSNTVLRKNNLTELGVENHSIENSLSYVENKEDKDLKTYYFRGNVTDNYVNFAGMCWRIIRIGEDGSTKLILEDQSAVCGSGNINWTLGTGVFGYETITANDGTTVPMLKYLNTSSSMASSFKTFQNDKLTNYLNMLKAGDWCLADAAYTVDSLLINDKTNYYKGRTGFNYSTTKRLANNEYTFDCDGTIMNDWADNESNPTPMYVGGITLDEVIYSGASNQGSKINNYLSTETNFWTMTPTLFTGNADGIYIIKSDNTYRNNGVWGTASYRPAVSLSPEVKVTSGNGTLSSPYNVGI